MDRLASIVRNPQYEPQEPAQMNITPCVAGMAGHVITVTSGKRGVGKSSISVNLSIALSQQGQKVCLFDADINLENTNILLGLTPSLTLYDFLKEQLDISEILSSGPEGIQIVPAATGIADFNNLDKPQQTHLLSALHGLEKEFDYLIIDTAAGVDETLVNFLLAAPYTIVTITPEPTSLTDAFSLLKVLKERDFDQPVFVIVNMVDSSAVAKDAFKRFNGITKYLQLKLSYLGYIPNDNRVSESVRKQQAVLMRYPETRASRCILDITSRLKRLLDTQEEPVDSSFSAYFDALAGPDLPLPQDEEDAISKADDEPEFVWDIKEALEYLHGITPDEAVEFLAEAILNWNMNNNDISIADQQCLLDCAVNSSWQEEQHPRLDKLLQHNISDIDAEVEQETMISASEQHPDKTGERSVSDSGPLEPHPLEPMAEDNENPGSLYALYYASLLGAKESYLK